MKKFKNLKSILLLTSVSVATLITTAACSNKKEDDTQKPTLEDKNPSSGSQTETESQETPKQPSQDQQNPTQDQPKNDNDLAEGTIKDDNSKDTQDLDPSKASEGNVDVDSGGTAPSTKPQERPHVSGSTPQLAQDNPQEYKQLSEKQRFDVDFQAYKNAFLDNLVASGTLSKEPNYSEKAQNTAQYDAKAQKLSQPSLEQAQFLGFSYGKEDPKNANQTKLIINSDAKPSTSRYWNSQPDNLGKARYIPNQTYKNIALQTFSLEIINTLPGSSNKDAKTSFGTAWILDYQLDESGQYPTKWYLATNVHVANAFLKLGEDGNYKSRAYGEELGQKRKDLLAQLDKVKKDNDKVAQEYLSYEKLQNLRKFLKDYDQADQNHINDELVKIAQDLYKQTVAQVQELENEIAYLETKDNTSTQVTKLKAQKATLTKESNDYTDVIKNQFSSQAKISAKVFMKSLITKLAAELPIKDEAQIDEKLNELLVKYNELIKQQKQIEADLNNFAGVTSAVVLHKFNEDLPLNQTLRTTMFDPRSESFTFKPEQIKTVYLGLDFLKTSPKDYVHSSYKYLDAEEMADFAVLEFDLTNSQNKYSYIQNNTTKDLQKEVVVHDAHELAQALTNNYAKLAKENQVHFSAKNLYDQYQEDKNAKLPNQQNTQPLQLPKQSFNLYAVGFPLADFDAQLSKDFNKDTNPLSEPEKASLKYTTSIWVNKPTDISKDPADVNGLNHQYGKGFTRALTWRNFIDKPGIVDALIVNPQLSGDKPFEIFVNDNNKSTSIENYKNSVVQNKPFKNSYYITYGLNYALGSWAPLGGASGSSVRDNDGNVVAINYFANQAALSSLAFAFRSNGINYDGLYGNYNMEKYDLIYGGAPQQRTSYRQALQSLYGNKVKTNLFPNGTDESKIPDQFKFK
ncbi:hypothetical protein V2E24_01085 [Mycoplasmopsis ciconiae]|uniref:DUF31 domain-containing protein n=1 Tax=Mycoplasmopsis ciconiae TaxID=561067 RepID=A0ABU7MM95_9BACT|nr:hypothetical protein [Mycoplasmopsis ciconiae]